MSKQRDKRAREIQDAIRAILLGEWDPIMVGGEPGRGDEYDPYIGTIYRMLVERATAERLAEHLVYIEQGKIGLRPAAADALLPVARRLLEIDIRL